MNKLGYRKPFDEIYASNHPTKKKTKKKKNELHIDHIINFEHNHSPTYFQIFMNWPLDDVNFACGDD